jgi:hypothetical protein
MMPVYNDWESLAKLLQLIDQACAVHGIKISIAIVDDGSNQSDTALREVVSAFTHISQILVIHLARNLGHQRAIALGLAYINEHMDIDQLIVMDCDGEDQPSDIFRLLDEHTHVPGSIIFAQRKTRSESYGFRFFYSLYRIMFRILTGTDISFGNFALIPALVLKRIVFLPNIWNHFAAGIIYEKLSWKAIPTRRGKRFDGKSKMNFTSLVIHGLSGISVFSDVLTVRLILLSLFVILFDILSFIALFVIKYLTPLAIPGWATSVAIGLVIIMLQAIMFLMLLLFVILNNRTNKLFVPAKDYHEYLWGVESAL